MFGREFDASWEVTEHVPGRKVAFTTDTAGHKVYGLWLFEPVPEGTWVRMLYHSPAGQQGPFGKLPERVLARVLATELQGALRNLKNLLGA